MTQEKRKKLSKSIKQFGILFLESYKFQKKKNSLFLSIKQTWKKNLSSREIDELFKS